MIIFKIMANIGELNKADNAIANEAIDRYYITVAKNKRIMFSVPMS